MDVTDVTAEIKADLKKNLIPYKKVFIGYEITAAIIGLIVGIFFGYFQALLVGTIVIPLIIAAIVIFGIIFWFPATVAKKRGHAYTVIIQVLVIAGLFTGVSWFIALVWAVFPSEKSIIDPVVGNVTGLGRRNAGDTIGAVKKGTVRGENFENKTDELIDQLIDMRTKGLISDEEFARKKTEILTRDF